MLYRNRKPGDMNEGKWISPGGKVEEGETPDECVVREVYEETGLRLLDARYRGLVHFRSDAYPDEDMYLFTASRYEGGMIECDEGELAWIEKSKLLSLTLWEGDRIFLKLLDEWEIDNYELATNDLESLDRKGWANYKAMPMAGNLQLVFYRSSPDDTDVVVKVNPELQKTIRGRL